MEAGHGRELSIDYMLHCAALLPLSVRQLTKEARQEDLVRAVDSNSLFKWYGSEVLDGGFEVKRTVTKSFPVSFGLESTRDSRWTRVDGLDAAVCSTIYLR